MSETFFFRRRQLVMISSGSLLVLSALFTAGCLKPVPPPPPDELITNTVTATTNTSATNISAAGMTDTALALGLLISADIADTFTNVRPSTIELNDHLDTEYLNDYEFFVGRRWYDRSTGSEVIGNAITLYPDADTAQQETESLVENYPLLDIATLGDSTFVAYDDPLLYYGGPSDPAHLIYRFTYGPYSAKIEVVDTGNVLDDGSVIQERLLALAQPLAERQYQKLVDLAVAPTTEAPSNNAIDHLPTPLTGLTLIGTVAVTSDEWLGVTYNMEAESIAGFVSGGMNRYIIDTEPAHVAEVAVLEFATADQAITFQAELLTSGAAAKAGTQLTLSDTIAAAVAVVDALEQETLTELQAVDGNYLIDVTVFAPFTDTDLTVARDQLNTIGEQVVTNFSAE